MLTSILINCHFYSFLISAPLVHWFLYALTSASFQYAFTNTDVTFGIKLSPWEYHIKMSCTANHEIFQRHLTSQSKISYLMNSGWQVLWQAGKLYRMVAYILDFMCGLWVLASRNSNVNWIFFPPDGREITITRWTSAAGTRTRKICEHFHQSFFFCPTVFFFHFGRDFPSQLIYFGIQRCFTYLLLWWVSALLPIESLGLLLLAVRGFRGCYNFLNYIFYFRYVL